MPRTAIAPGVGGNALAAMEHLDSALGDACFDLLADQGMRDGVEEPGDFHVIIDADPGERPIGILVVGVGQCSHHRALDGLEQLPPADPRRRITRPFSCTSISAIAALHSASEKKVRLRSRPNK